MDIFKDNGKRVVKKEISTKKNHLISAFKSFEVNISDKNKKYFDKVPSLLAAWEQIVVFVSESSESPEPEFESLFLHTLRFVLRAADWRHVSNATKTHLKITLQRFIEVIKKSKKLSSILLQCHVLESVINEDPWGHSVLQKIIQDEEVEELDDLVDYFHFENGKVIVVRLEMLLESKCEDMAARLAKYFLLTYNRTHPLEIDVNQSELDYINDIYFCSLYKTKTKTDLINEIKTFDLSDGLQLLKRYRKHNGVAENYNDYCKHARVWKCGKKVIELISSTLLANAVLHDDLVDSDIVLNDLIQEWASIHTTNQSDAFPPVALEMIRKFVLIARSSKCIYPFCSVLINNGCGKEIDLDQVSRCLIRAVNQNMNEIEKYRVSRDHEKLKSTYDQLSKGFVLISELFSEYKNIYKECLLTSFSLTPSRECIQKLETFVETVLTKSTETVPELLVKIEDAALMLIENKTSDIDNVKIENSIVNDAVIEVVTQLTEEIVTPKIEHQKPPEQNVPILNEIFENFGVVKTDDQVAIELNSSLKESPSTEMIKGAAPAYFAEVDSLKVDESIKTDLNSILRYQRYHTLTWDIEWNELKTNCEKYLEVFEQRGFNEVELKYLDLDYNQFKNRPIDYDEFCGIEKGYEHFVESSEESETEATAYRRSVGYSSGDTDFYEACGRKKRKKLDDDRRRRMKKKRVSQPVPKPEYDPDEIFDNEYRQFKVWQPGCEREFDLTPVVRKEKRRRSSDNESKTKKKRGRPRKFPILDELSDTNADSQSENQPPNMDADPQIENQPPEMDVKCETTPVKEEEIMPSDDTVLENISNTKSSPNNLQVLRQFRINLPKQLNDDVTETSKREEEIKMQKEVIVDTNQMQGNILKICIPKCDEIKVNGNLMLVKEIESCEKPKLKRKSFGTRNTSAEEKKSKFSGRNENEMFKRPKPKSSATLPFIDKRVPTLKLKRVRDPNEENIRECEIRIPKVNELSCSPKVVNIRECEIRLPKINSSDVFGITNSICHAVDNVNLEIIENVLDVDFMDSKVINEAIDVSNHVQKSNDLSEDIDKKNLEERFNDLKKRVDSEQLIDSTKALEMESSLQNTTDSTFNLEEIKIQTLNNAANKIEKISVQTLNNAPDIRDEDISETSDDPWFELDKELYSCFNNPLPEVPIISPTSSSEKSTVNAEISETSKSVSVLTASVANKKVTKRISANSGRNKIPKPPRKPREKSIANKSKKLAGRPSSKTIITASENEPFNTTFTTAVNCVTPLPVELNTIPNNRLYMSSFPAVVSPSKHDLSADLNNKLPSSSVSRIPTSTAKSRFPGTSSGRSSSTPKNKSTSTVKRRLSTGFTPRVSDTSFKNRMPTKSAAPSSYLNSYHDPIYQPPSSLELQKLPTVYGAVSSTVTSPTTAHFQAVPQTTQLPVNSSAENMHSIPPSSFIPSNVSPMAYLQSSSSTSYSPDSMMTTYSSLSSHPSTSSTVTSTSVHSVQYKRPKSNCKLRAALQKPVEQSNVNLYNSAYTIKSPVRGGNSEAVSQILGVYRDTLDKFPELEHVPAPRKRNNNLNSPKRQRRSKKNAQSKDTNINSLSVAQTMSDKVKRNYSSSSVSNTNQISCVHVPQTGHGMQSNQSSVNVPSNLMQKLPTYVSTNVSSQNYGVVESKNVVDSYLNTSQPSAAVVNGYTSNDIMASANTYLVNGIQPSMTMCNTNMVNGVISNGPTLLNLDEVNVVKNMYPNQQNYSTVTSGQSNYIELQSMAPTSISTNNGCGMNNNNEYKMFSYSVDPSTSSASQNTVIVNGSSDNYKNDAQISPSVATSSSTMVLATNTENVNNDLKTPFLYATVYSNDETTELNDPGVCISIPEEAYSESYLGSCLALIDNNSLLGQNDDLYMKSQTNDVTANTQNMQYLATNDTVKQDNNSVYENSVIINMNDIFYPNSNYGTEMNYGT